MPAKRLVLLHLFALCVLVAVAVARSAPASSDLRTAQLKQRPSNVTEIIRSYGYVP